MLNKKEMKAKIAVGDTTVWLILMVSLAATLAYWYVLSGIESAGELSQFWQVIIWLVVGVGLVAEIIKKVTLSTFRNRNIWMTATFVSVVTVMGTYSILDQTRQNDLTKQSDNYKDSRVSKLNADAIASKYAYAESYDLEELEIKLDQVIVDRDNRKIKYNTYLKRKEAIEKKLGARRSYDSAVATSGAATANMAGGNATGASANPLLSNIAGVLNGSEALIKTVFYLLVTILLEVAAFWIGGQVATMKKQLNLTEAELLDMKNEEIFGFSMRDLQRELFDRVNRSQQDAIEAEYEVKQIRKKRKDKDTNEHLSSGAVASSVNEKREMSDDNQVKAKYQSDGSEVVNESPAVASSVNEKREMSDDNQVKAKYQSDSSEVVNESPTPRKTTVDNSPAIGFQLPETTNEIAEYFSCRTCGKHGNKTVGANGFCSPKCESKGTGKPSTSERQSELDLNGSKNDLNHKINDLNHKKGSKQPKPFNNEKKQPLKKDQGMNQKNDLCASAFSDSGALNSDTEKRHFSDTDLLYPEWKKEVLKKECGLTQRPVVFWIKKTLGVHTSKQVKVVTDDYAKVIMELLYRRGLSDKVIVSNPKWKGAGRTPKYILA